MLTDADIQKIRKLVKEELKEELERQLFELKAELVQAFTAKEESMAHSQMLLDHEGRIRFLEECVCRRT